VTGGSSIVICWDRRSDDLVIGTFVPGQIQFLREQLCGLRDLLDWRMRQYSTEYPLGDQLGMPLPQEPPDDDRLRAIIRYHWNDTEPEWAVLWWEPNLFGDLRVAIERVLATLPERGGVVQFDHVDQADAWAWALAALRIALAVTARLPEALHGLTPDDTDDEFERRVFRTICWLQYVVDTLYEIVDQVPAR
jgi:hypothetical protein